MRVRRGLVAGRFKQEPGGVVEDAVVGDQRDVEAEGSGCDPAIGVVLALAEGMADAFAVDAKAGIGEHEVGAGVDGLGHRDAGFELV